MSSCIPKKRIRRVRFFELDNCQRLITTGTPMLDWDGFNEIRWRNLIEDGPNQDIVGPNGHVCISDPGCPIDKGVAWTFTECRDNNAFAALTGLGTLSFSAGEVDGFDRIKMESACPALAMEILFDVPTLCDDDGNPQCIALLVPAVRLFKDTAERVVDGRTTVRGSYTAQAALNPRLFELFADGVPAGALAHWASWQTEIEAGNRWYLQRLIDCPTIEEEQSCDLQEYPDGTAALAFVQLGQTSAVANVAATPAFATAANDVTIAFTHNAQIGFQAATVPAGATAIDSNYNYDAAGVSDGSVRFSGRVSPAAESVAMVPGNNSGVTSVLVPAAQVDTSSGLTSAIGNVAHARGVIMATLNMPAATAPDSQLLVFVSIRANPPGIPSEVQFSSAPAGLSEISDSNWLGQPGAYMIGTVAFVGPYTTGPLTFVPSNALAASGFDVVVSGIEVLRP